MKNVKKIVGGIIVVGVYLLYIFFGEDIGLTEEDVVNIKNKVIDSQVINVLPDGELRIHYLDVGQGDSILIENAGEYMLIDAGNNEDGKLLVKYFKNLGIKKFTYLVGTHAHEDHIGGMDDVINNFEVSNFYMPDVVTTTKTFEDVIEALENKNIYFDTPKIGDNFNFGGCNFLVLNVSNDDSDLNDTSIVLRLVYGKNKFLFTGDATSVVEDKILKLGYDISSDVLKVPHHGSEYSNSLKFIKKVNPEYSIISVGAYNSYNHPHNKAIKNLESVGSTIYRTDKDGTVIVSSDGENINISFKDINLDG